MITIQNALIVDDSPVEQRLGGDLLKHLGYNTQTAKDGAEALKIIKENNIHLVICDMEMPVMTGLELLSATRDFSQPPIFIMYTSLNDAGHAVEAIQGGAYGYLTKPLREDPLRKAIVDALNKYQKEADARLALHKIKTVDPLTGLLNKEAFEWSFSRHLQSKRKREQAGALLFLNVDELRFVNNTYGHHEGDLVLQHIANLIRKSIRTEDLAARFGGDVFAINLSDIAPQDVHLKAQRMLSEIERSPLFIGGQERTVTVTMGIVTYPPFHDDYTLISNAEFALHQARTLGKNRFHIYDDHDEARKREAGAQFNSLEAIKHALNNDLFDMYFQPIVDLQTGEAKHYEALIRMFDDQKNMIPPDHFIKTAEKFGLIGRIDRWVIGTCLERLAQIARINPNVGMSINLSGLSMNDMTLLEELERDLKRSGVNPSKVIFEITETAAFHNIDYVQQFIRRIKNLGCRFALDDFGVGFSSFYYIKQLDVDFLKIDGSFIKNMVHNQDDQVFVRAMVEISQVLGIAVIAEWVENAEITDLLKQYGVKFGQGYYFGKPSPMLPLPPSGKPASLH